MASSHSASRAASPAPSQLPPVPPSPGYSIASTANHLSSFNLPLPPPPRPSHAVLSQADIERSQEAYSDLLASAKEYRLALAALSTAASSFGSALESCARLKEARAEPIGPSAAQANMSASFTARGPSCTADTLMAASGVQHLVANHQQILSETVYRSFEVPLLDDLDQWRTVIEDEKDAYQQRMTAQSKEIKRLEKEGMKLHRQRHRDVSRFRAHLVQLTNKLDGLTTLHADHSRTLLGESQETSGRVADASSSLVRAEVDIFESLARKGWTGGGLDDILERGQDLFAADDAAAGGASAPGPDPSKLFSILPPRSILADSSSPDKSRPAAGGGGGGGGGQSHHSRGDSLVVDAADRYQSLTAVAESHAAAGDADSVMSSEFTRPRNARPFSPQPIRRTPLDVTAESLGALPQQQDAEHVEDRGGADEDEDDDAMQRSELRMPSAEEDGGFSHDGTNGEAALQSPDSPRGRSPAFVTDESSPDHSG